MLSSTITFLQISAWVTKLFFIFIPLAQESLSWHACLGQIHPSWLSRYLSFLALASVPILYLLMQFSPGLKLSADTRYHVILSALAHHCITFLSWHLHQSRGQYIFVQGSTYFWMKKTKCKEWNLGFWHYLLIDFCSPFRMPLCLFSNSTFTFHLPPLLSHSSSICSNPRDRKGHFSFSILPFLTDCHSKSQDPFFLE